MNLRDALNKPLSHRPTPGWVYVLLSFVLPALLFTLALAMLGITPFGKHDLAITDAQYYLNGQLFLARLLKGQENWLYSLNNGLGGNNWSILSWGAFHPGLLLALFADQMNIPTVFTWICVVNVSLCGLAMYALMAALNGHKAENLLFSTAYALMGFMMVNCYQVGFVLGPQLLPLMVLGLVRMKRGRSPLVYVVSLASCCFFNFYFAFHLCVASAAVFLAWFLAQGDVLSGRRVRAVLGWLVPSVIAGLLAAPMWLPALKAFTGGGGRMEQTSILEYTLRENMPFLQMFSKLFTGAHSTDELVNGLPNIFVGILCLALAVLYFMNRRVDKRRRMAAGAVVGFYLMTFFVKSATLLMHGGTHTNWFPYRYSYVFSFLVICLAAEEFRYLDELTWRDARRCFIGLAVAAVLIFGTSYGFISGTAALLDLLLLAVMGGAFHMYRTAPDRAPRRVLVLFLLLVGGMNLFFNAYATTKKVQDWELDLGEYTQNILTNGTLIDGINGAETGFFRMEKDVSQSNSVGADPMLYNYNGVSHSGPADRMFIHQGLCRLGVNWFDMRHWYAAGAPAAADSLLGLKYIVSERDLAAEKGYEEKADFNGMKIYRSDRYLGLPILANGDAADVTLGDDVFANLNAVWQAMTGSAQKVFYEEQDVTFSLVTDYAAQSVTGRELKASAAAAERASRAGETPDQAENASYMQYTFTAARDGSVYVFDTSIPDSVNGLIEPAMRYVGTYKKGDTVEGKFPVNAAIGTGDLLRGYCVNQVFAYADDEALAEMAKTLNDRDVTMTVEHENRLTGTFTADEDRLLLFTLPWDEGWTCTVDGKAVPIEKTWDLFMSVSVPAGSHTWEMHFVPAWLNYGLILCAAAAAGLVAVLIVGKKRGPVLPAQTGSADPADDAGETARDPAPEDRSAETGADAPADDAPAHPDN